MSLWLTSSHFQTDIDLFMVVKVSAVHIIAGYGFYQTISGQILLNTVLFHLALFYLSVIGMSCGVHRLWSHRSYATTRPIQYILMILQTYTGLYSIFDWSLDHRIHHKFVDTDADPYNIKRGLFFAQFGWIMLRKTDKFEEKVKTIDMTDLTSDPMVMFQHNHYMTLRFFLYSSAALIPCVLWDETFLNSMIAVVMCYVIEAHQVMTINSLAHTLGFKPYDTGIEPTFSRLVSYLTLGEGYHNFHHTFPKDYTQCEVKWSRNFNVSTILIDVCHWFGWVSDLCVVDSEQIAKRRQRTGDSTVQIESMGFLFDYSMGTLVFTWAIWLILLAKLLYSCQSLLIS